MSASIAVARRKISLVVNKLKRDVRDGKYDLIKQNGVNYITIELSDLSALVEAPDVIRDIQKERERTVDGMRENYSRECSKVSKRLRDMRSWIFRERSVRQNFLASHMQTEEALKSSKADLKVASGAVEIIAQQLVDDLERFIAQRLGVGSQTSNQDASRHELNSNTIDTLTALADTARRIQNNIKKLTKSNEQVLTRIGNLLADGIVANNREFPQGTILYMG